MYLMIDNYDSFTYNLYALFKECNRELKIIKNDEYINADEYRGIILSPGPSSPENSGTTLKYLENYKGKKPIFGVCLGMQSIAYSMGCKITSAKTIKHGKVDEIDITKDSILFKDMPKSFNAVRYHSLAVDIDDKYITSVSKSDGVVMSIEDRENKIFGVQFHPESIQSEYGKKIIQNFLEYTEGGLMDNLIKRVNSGEILEMPDAEILFEGMVTGELTEAQIASILTSMKFRGESVDELAALVSTLNRHKKKFNPGVEKCVDTCGTGGDGKSTVNVSTAVSIILAALGYNIVKHGNRAQSGKVGSADILMEMGLDINYEKQSQEDFFKQHNFIYMNAPNYHPALKGIGKVRREIKVPTIFNFVGPLVNPANPDFQIIGINKRERLDFIANTILKLGKNNITVYSSLDGYDEVSSKDKTECITIKNNNLERFTIDPSDFFEPFDMPVVNDNSQAKKLFGDGLSGSNEEIVNIFALNTALALKTMGEADLAEGFNLVKETIKSGKVKQKLDDIVG